MSSFSIFSQSEDSIYSQFQHGRDKLFEPACRFLTKNHIKPDVLTYFNLALVLPFINFLNTAPLLSLFSLLLSFVMDALDGCLARYQKTTSVKGVLLDIFADHLFFFSVVLSFMSFKMIDGFWGATYLLNYLLLIVLIMALRSRNVGVFYVIRSKYILYALWFIFLVAGISFLDVFLVFFSIYMFLSNLFLFHTYRCSLS